MRSYWKLGLTMMLAACGGEEKQADDEHVDRGDISISYRPSSDAQATQIVQAMRDEKLFEQLADGLNETMKFPRDLPVRYVDCGEANAFYDPSTQSLSMCYELLSQISQVANDGEADQQELGERIVGTWLFVFFHELGHGLVDMYDLPITGREEDSVDDFSAVLMVEAGLESYVIHAAEYWAATGSNMLGELNFADEHSLNQQRFYQILCLVYGSNPSKYQGLVTNGILPDSRAERCPAEYQQKANAWDTLLTPWAK